jgi:hypothetical protein
MFLVRALLRPFGYLLFVVAVAAVSIAGWLLGDEHELGFFANRLGDAIWRFPEVTRRGIQIAWAVWAVLFVLAISDTTPWDEIGLGAVAVFVLWRHCAGRRRTSR